QLFADPTGQIKYLAVFSDHRSPKITSSIQSTNKNVVMFDLFKGQSLASKDGRGELTLRPGEGTIIAIAPRAPEMLRMTMPDQVVGGQPVKIAIDSANCAGFVLDTFDASNKRVRRFSLANIQPTDGHAAIEIPTAQNDPPGEYRVVVTESMSRLHAEG